MARGKKAGGGTATKEGPGKASQLDQKAKDLEAGEAAIANQENENRLRKKELELKDRAEKAAADEKAVREAEARAQKLKEDQQARQQEEDARRRERDARERKREDEERQSLLDIIATVPTGDRGDLKWALFRKDDGQEEAFVDYAALNANLYEVAKRHDEEEGGYGGTYFAKLWNGTRWCTRAALSRMVTSEANQDLIEKVPMQTKLVIHGDGQPSRSPASRFGRPPFPGAMGRRPVPGMPGTQPPYPGGLTPYGQALLQSHRGPQHPDNVAIREREKEERQERKESEAKLDKEREARMQAEISAIKAAHDNNNLELIKLMSDGKKGGGDKEILAHMLQSQQNTTNMMFKMMDDSRSRDESRRQDERDRAERERREQEQVRRDEQRERDRKYEEEKERRRDERERYERDRREERDRLETQRREDLDRERTHQATVLEMMKQQNKAPEEQMRMIGNMSTMVSGVMSSSMTAQMQAMKTAQDAIKSLNPQDDGAGKSEFQKLLETILPHSKDIILGAAQQGAQGVPMDQITDQATAQLEARVRQAQVEKDMGATPNPAPEDPAGPAPAETPAPAPPQGDEKMQGGEGLAEKRDLIMPIIVGAIQEDDPQTLAETFLNPEVGVPAIYINTLPITPLIMVRAKLLEIATPEEAEIIKDPATDDFFKRFKECLRAERTRVRAIQDAYLEEQGVLESADDDDDGDEDDAPQAPAATSSTREAP